MLPAFKKLHWKPSTVSWLSFAFMSLIVAAAGLVGTTLIFNYLHQRLMEHGIQHNRDIAASLIPKLEQSVRNNPADVISILSHAITDYKAFGFRLFVIDATRSRLALDSENLSISPLSIRKSWLQNARLLNGERADIALKPGAYITQKGDHPMLVWTQPMQLTRGNRWLLGIAKDQKALSDFTDDLHWYVDAVLLFTLIAITLLGYIAMRSTGRRYERTLESKVRQRTEALKQAHEDALGKERLATIGKTAAVLTHEMRNPMASIKLALSALNRSQHRDAREQRRIHMVLSEIDRLDALLSGTLDYVRPVKLSSHPIDLDRLLSTIIQQQESTLQQKRIRLTQHNCIDCALLRMDQAQMHQVILNLIKNAIEACPEQGQIQVSLQREQENLTLKISNDSAPLSTEVLQHAFDPFYSTKPRGTGLGLGLVKRVVQEHGGSVELKNQQDGGVIIILTFPL